MAGRSDAKTVGRLRGVQIEGTTAVVTGGASGIGRGTALELARRGADVVLADIHDERLADTAAEITALGQRALAVRCDVTSDADVEALAAAAFHGRVLSLNQSLEPSAGIVATPLAAVALGVVSVQTLGIVAGALATVGGVVLLLLARGLAPPTASEYDPTAGSSRDAIALGGAAPG